PARLLRDPLLAHRRPAARARIHRLADRGGTRRAHRRCRTARQLPTTSGAVSRRKAASTLSAVMRPVRGLSGSGMFSMVMVRSEESDRTVTVWVLRVTPGSAHTSTCVASGPMPASDRATETLTLAGKPAIASRALPANTLSGAFKPSTDRPLATSSGAPASPAGGFLVTIVAEAIRPSA